MRLHTFLVKKNGAGINSCRILKVTIKLGYLYIAKSHLKTYTVKMACIVSLLIGHWLFPEAAGINTRLTRQGFKLVHFFQ